MIRPSKLAPDLAELLRRMAQAARARRERILEESGYSSWEAYAAAEERRRVAKAVRALGVPKQVADADFDRLLYEPAGAAEQWVQREIVREGEALRLRGTCLLLSGPPGVGKSWAAMAALRRLIEAGFEAEWAYAVDMLAGLYPSEVRSSRLATVDVLVVDDLGSEARADVHKLQVLLTHRHAQLRTTILTTTIAPGQLADHYGERIAHRLHQWATVARFDAPAPLPRRAVRELADVRGMVE